MADSFTRKKYQLSAISGRCRAHWSPLLERPISAFQLPSPICWAPVPCRMLKALAYGRTKPVHSRPLWARSSLLATRNVVRRACALTELTPSSKSATEVCRWRNLRIYRRSDRRNWPRRLAVLLASTKIPFMRLAEVRFWVSILRDPICRVGTQPAARATFPLEKCLSSWVGCLLPSTTRAPWCSLTSTFPNCKPSHGGGYHQTATRS